MRKRALVGQEGAGWGGMGRDGVGGGGSAPCPVPDDSGDDSGPGASVNMWVMCARVRARGVWCAR